MIEAKLKNSKTQNTVKLNTSETNQLCCLILASWSTDQHRRNVLSKCIWNRIHSKKLIN